MVNRENTRDRGSAGSPVGMRGSLRRVAPLLGSLAVAAATIVLAEMLAAAVGVVPWKHRTDPAADLPSDQAAQVRRLQNWVGQGGRARPVEGSSLWLYEPTTQPGLNVGPEGFRGAMPGPRGNAELRIAVFGGSSVFGWLVADEHTLPALLEAELRRRFPDRRVRVLNLGVEGYRVQQEIELAARWVPDLEPDAVLMVHGANDAIVGVERGFVIDPPWQPGAPGPPLAVIFRRPGLAGVLREAAGRSRVVTAIHEARLDRRTREVHAPADRLEELIAGASGQHRELCEMSQSWGIPVVVAFQPTVSGRRDRDAIALARWRFAEGRRPGLTTLYEASVEALMNSEANQCPGNVVLLDHRRTLDAMPERAFLDWVHPTPAGNQQFAAAVAPQLAAIVR